MPPRKKADPAVVVPAMFAQYDLLVAWSDGADLSRPTRLEGWTVAELVAHVATNIKAVHRYLVRPGSPATMTVLDYLSVMRDVAPGVDERAREQAAAGSFDVAGEVVRARAAFAELDAAVIAKRTVDARLGSITLTDFLVTRCLEGVVHGLDLLDALGWSPAADPEALRIVVGTLGQLLARVAPGRAIEVRVPGPSGTAVQCGEGPAHRRGTPGNVVEADAIAFVELCSGRLTWQDAMADGRVRASGNRADLSAWLPLLG